MVYAKVCKYQGLLNITPGISNNIATTKWKFIFYDKAHYYQKTWRPLVLFVQM